MDEKNVYEDIFNYIYDGSYPSGARMATMRTKLTNEYAKLVIVSTWDKTKEKPYGLQNALDLNLTDWGF